MFSTKSLGCLADVPDYEEFESETEELKRYGEDGRLGGTAAKVDCPYPFRQPTVFWDGTVVGCEFDYECDAPWGRVGEASFRELWNGRPARALRAATRGAEPAPDFCRLCPYRDRVQGGSALEMEELRAP
jgi:MoaA/NifB/PqqE/SkfB family radical SAM enzyme